MSKARVSQWTNTIQGFVAQRQREKVERLEREELERRKLDLIEHQLNEEKRLIATEKAFKVAHDHQDHVKAFHTGMLLSDVMNERDLQIAHQKRKK